MSNLWGRGKVTMATDYEAKLEVIYIVNKHDVSRKSLDEILGILYKEIEP
ncbi:hypothetical protein LCGC14_0380560 [marine sediment metagenome]|uniref:Uncharacterized protein n=1 Tax=marine sediment metagenome TaxID=412755 RepID=A0A0F9T292_9ZZZZ